MKSNVPFEFSSGPSPRGQRQTRAVTEECLWMNCDHSLLARGACAACPGSGLLAQRTVNTSVLGDAREPAGGAGGRDSGSLGLVRGRVTEVVSEQRLAGVGESCRHGGPGEGELVLGSGAPMGSRAPVPFSALRG